MKMRCNSWQLSGVGVKKNNVYKNQGSEPIHQKYKANESMSRQNTKEKKKKKPTIKEK